MAADFLPHQAALVAWAYAKAGHDAPALLDALARQLPQWVGSDEARDTLPIWAWAYATAQHAAPQVFATLATALVREADARRLSPSDIANVAWAYAVAGEPRTDVFASLAAAATASLEAFDTRQLAKMAWAFAAVEYVAPEAFVGALVERCEATAWCLDRDLDDLRQLHQWQLWGLEQQLLARRPADSQATTGGSLGPPPFSPALSALCRAAFAQGASADGVAVPGGARVTSFQLQVTNTLARMQVRPVAEVTGESGYSFDVLVEWQGETVAVEVDGPHHFLLPSRTPTAATRLKRRQARRLGSRLCSIPFWEWNQCPREPQRVELLRAALDRSVLLPAGRNPSPDWPWAPAR